MVDTLRQAVCTAALDPDDRLLAAEEPLLSLQLACGGEPDGQLAVPALLNLLRSARSLGLGLSRRFEATDGAKRITAWAEISPVLPGPEAGGGPWNVRILNWRSEEERAPDGPDPRRTIIRDMAEVRARLDRRQNLLAFALSGNDLNVFRERLEGQLGHPWFETVSLLGGLDGRVSHWRLLDGARCRLPGSTREWEVLLDPLGMEDGETGPAGFDLYLQALTGISADVEQLPPGTPIASIGRDLAPVLRQPLTSIVANAETIRSRLAGPLAQEYSTYAADIAAAGKHLLGLLEDMSDLEVVEDERFTTAADQVDLADIARRAAGILSVRAREKGINIIAPPAQETQPAVAEFRRVLQILLNLLSNAIRYSEEQSQIWLCVAEVDDRATVTVADQGYGLDADQQARVFEKFERLGRSGDGGSGLGLYISRRLARAMGGDLTVDSAPGQGARFTLAVPLR